MGNQLKTKLFTSKIDMQSAESTTRKWGDLSYEDQKATMKKLNTIINEAGLADKVKL